MAILHQILRDTAKEVRAATKRRSLADLKRMIRDAPPLRSFRSALSGSFGIIAEIKKRSPSGGEMNPENFARAPAAYAKSPVVKAVSVLTNATHFGMDIQDLTRVRKVIRQPILRKDFIITEYQIYQARAFGADAILLMASILDRKGLQILFDAATELGLDVLFEAHKMAEIRDFPKGAEICGINSRNFKASDKLWDSKKLPPGEQAYSPGGADPTVEFKAFSLIKHLPKDAIKVAESGMRPHQIHQVVKLGYDAVLVGTTLLKAPAGIENMLRQFERELKALR